MPGEITITASIISFILIAVVISGFILLVHAALALQESLINAVKNLYIPEKQSLYIIDAYRINSTSVELNLTVRGVPIAPLSESEVIVKYTSNKTGKPYVELLRYENNPGWSVEKIYDGSLVRNISAGDYLYPGEVADIIINLPSKISPGTPIVMDFVSNTGSSASYLLGEG